MNYDTYNVTLPVIDMIATGARIQFYRQRDNLSVQQMQKIFGFRHPQAIYNWLAGKTLPSTDNLLALSKLFRVTINDLLAVSDKEVSFCV